MHKLLFIYDYEDEGNWQDGLWAALNLLDQDYELDRLNLSAPTAPVRDLADYSIVLGWGAFNSQPEHYVRSLALSGEQKRGLLLAGYALPHPTVSLDYDLVFYETDWSLQWLKTLTNPLPPKTHFIKAFGVNTDIFTQQAMFSTPVFDYLTVGAFAQWKRQERLIGKPGIKFAVGQIQKQNLTESVEIIGELLLGGVGVSDIVPAQTLAKLYHLSKTVFIPADLNGGGERAVLEAKACGRNVEVLPDNPKLKELVDGPVLSHHDYYTQLKQGIELCLSH